VYPVYSGHMARKSAAQKKKELIERLQSIESYKRSLRAVGKTLDLDRVTNALTAAKAAYKNYMMTNSNESISDYTKFYRGMAVWLPPQGLNRVDKNTMKNIPPVLSSAFLNYKIDYPNWRVPEQGKTYKMYQILHWYIRIDKWWTKDIIETRDKISDFRAVYDKLVRARYAYWCEKSIAEQNKPKPPKQVSPPQNKQYTPKVVTDAVPAIPAAGRRRWYPNKAPPRKG
jgi:hypothetical protein